MLYLFICAFLGLIALRREGEDWMRVEKKRDDVLANRSTVSEMVSQIERVRRVTWRMGVLGALVLASALVSMNLIPMKQFVAACAPAWIVVTSVLNFRAYHVEDEGTFVFRMKGQGK